MHLEGAALKSHCTMDNDNKSFLFYSNWKVFCFSKLMRQCTVPNNKIPALNKQHIKAQISIRTSWLAASLLIVCSSVVQLFAYKVIYQLIQPNISITCLHLWLYLQLSICNLGFSNFHINQQFKKYPTEQPTLVLLSAVWGRNVGRGNNFVLN